MIIRKKCSEPRDTVLTIRLSRSEHNRLKQMASELGISVAKLLQIRLSKSSIGIS
mgnify:CR=1 FL=1